MQKIKIKKLNKNAQTPTKNKGDAGYDLYCAKEITIMPQERGLVKTDICISIPDGYYGHISDRSGNALKSGAHCLGKILDSAYRGAIGVIIQNLDKYEPITFKVGDRPAQIIFKKYEDFDFEEVDSLEETDRGSCGFGSTGN